MKRSFVIKNKKFNPFKLDVVTCILFTLFFCGIILGIAVVKNADNDLKNIMFSFFDNYLSTKCQNGFIMAFSGVLCFFLVFVLFELLFGLCAVGTPFIFIILTCFGFFCGLEASLVILNWGIKGILYFVLVNLLCNTITAAILIKCCCESIRMSIVLLNCILGKDNLKRNFCNFKEYTINYIVLVVPIIIGVLISTILFKVFCSLFIVI